MLLENLSSSSMQKHTPHHTHVVWCHLRALIWLGGWVWFGLVSLDSIRFHSIRCCLLVLVSAPFGAGSISLFFNIFIAFTGWPFILSKVQFIAKWNAAIPASAIHRSTKVRWWLVGSSFSRPLISVEFFIFLRCLLIAVLYFLFTSIVLFWLTYFLGGSGG